MLKINAESEDSPLRRLNSNIISVMKKINSKKQYPQRKFEMNTESPFKLDKLKYNNLQPSKLSLKEDGVNEINKTELLNKLNLHSPKAFIKYNSDNRKYDKIENSLNLDLPKIKSPALKNLNEYDIQENYKRNGNRIIVLKTEPVEDYNIILHKNKKNSPKIIEINKWPLFYENYHIISSERKAFHKKKGIFTQSIDKKMPYTSKSKEVVNIIKYSDYSSKFKIIESNFLYSINKKKLNYN